MSPGDLVVVSCGSPREKFWGVLLALAVPGVTIRAIPLEAFEDWLRQCASPEAPMIGPVTVFLPAHRLERVELDETSGAAEGLGERFRRVVGREPRELLVPGYPLGD